MRGTPARWVENRNGEQGTGNWEPGTGNGARASRARSFLIPCFPFPVPRSLLLLLLLSLVVPRVARAADAPAAANRLPPQLRGAGIDQRLGEAVPLDLVFRDEQGAPVRLGDALGEGKRPVVLALVYYQCPMLCNLVLNGLLKAMRAISLEAGRDFDVVAVSFDPREGPALAAAKKAAYVERYGRPNGAAGWHFLTGEQAPIAALAAAVGFRYRFDEERGEFVHAAALTVLTPDGKVARYLFGVEPSSRDLRLALVEASAGKIGTPLDRALLYCFRYDAAAGRYGAVVLNLVRGGAVATLAAFALFYGTLARRRRRR